MFRLSLLPANPSIAKKWLVFSGIVTAGSGTLTFLSLTQRLKDLFPTKLDETYIYMALAFSVIGGFPLIFTRKVLSVSIAQFGVFLGLTYLIFAFAPVFKTFAKDINAWLTFLFIVVFIIFFFDGLKFAAKEKSWSDFFLGIFIIIIFIALAIIPL